MERTEQQDEEMRERTERRGNPNREEGEREHLEARKLSKK